MPLGAEAGLGPGNIVLDGNPTPPKGVYSPQFSAHVYCGQTAGCIRIPLGTEVGLDQPRRHCFRWGPSSPSLKGHSLQFSTHVRYGQTAEWTEMPLGIGRPRPRRLCQMVTQLPLPRKGHSLPQNCRPMSIVAKRLDGSRCHLVWR